MQLPRRWCTFMESRSFAVSVQSLRVSFKLLIKFCRVQLVECNGSSSILHWCVTRWCVTASSLWVLSRYLSLESNNLSGTIPAGIGLATSLASLLLDLNHLTGTLPDELTRLTLMK